MGLHLKVAMETFEKRVLVNRWALQCNFLPKAQIASFSEICFLWGMG